MRTIKYWYCPNCGEEIPSSLVTNQELCDTCGHPVVWIEGIDPARFAEICQAEREGWLYSTILKSKDTVYVINSQNELNEMTVGYVYPHGEMIKGKLCNYYLQDNYTYCCKREYDFGKTVFLTKAEAEKALAGRGNV